MYGRLETSNPYYFGVYTIIDRLKWDMRLESWRSRTKLKKLKDTYRGKKAVIICNGPSLLQTSLEQISNVYTFGLNKINLLFDKSKFRPSSIVAVNPFVIEQNQDFYSETQIPLFLTSTALRHVKARPNIAYLHSTPQRKFARDCSMSLNEGSTVTYVAMQLAYHMGFSKVALVGCDHSFATKGPSNKTVVSGESDPNHFDPNYFSGGMKWQLPDLEGSEKSYALARDVYEVVGRKIYNCTVGGNLPTYERMPLGEFLSL